MDMSRIKGKTHHGNAKRIIAKHELSGYLTCTTNIKMQELHTISLY